MALTYNQLDSITEKKFIPKMVDNIFDSNPLLMKLKEKSPKLDGGERIMVPLLYAATTASGWFSGLDNLDGSDNDSFTAAAFTWKQAYANVTISRLDELKNSGDAGKLNFVKNKVMAAEKTIKDILGTGVFNDGTTTNAFVGLRAIIGTSSTIGGISQTDYSWWRGQVDSTSTVMTIPTLQTQFSAASIDSDSPDMILSNRTNYDRYYSLLQPQQRFVDSKMAAGGFVSLMFNGKPWVVDSHSPANHVFMINTNYLDLYIHKDENFRYREFQDLVGQNGKQSKIFFAGALCSSNNRMHAKLSALTA